MSQSIDLSDIRISAEGFAVPPRDMMEAAQRSLSAEAFAQLMERTGGRAPTPAELVAFADAEREIADNDVVPPNADPNADPSTPEAIAERKRFAELDSPSAQGIREQIANPPAPFTD